MLMWKPHSLARPHADQLNLRMHDKVAAKVDLAGVPAGTKGKVIVADGFNWLRYRVQFDNGVELADLDARHLDPAGSTAKRLAKQAGRASKSR